jgi:hypothetical protein
MSTHTVRTVQTVPVKSGELVISQEIAELFKDTYVSGAIDAAAYTATPLALPQSIATFIELANPDLPEIADAYCIGRPLAGFLALQVAHRCGAISSGVYIKTLLPMRKHTQHILHIEQAIIETIGKARGFDFAVLPEDFIEKYPNVKDAFGSTALIYLVSSGYSEFIQKLINMPECDLGHANIFGQTALTKSCCLIYLPSRTELALALLETGRARPEQIDAGGNTALIYVCHNASSYLDIILAIIATGHGLPDHIGRDNCTAFAYICDTSDRVKYMEAVASATASAATKN